MPRDDDFASFMQQRPGALLNRLRRGDKVKGEVTHLAADSVFVALGTRADGRVPRAELCDARGNLQVALGEAVEATVVDPDAEGGPLLAVTLGKDRHLDLESVQMAFESATPVEATVTRAVKAGLELQLGGARAFCPASQIERGYVSDVTAYVGQTLRVIVTEIKDQGRSVVVSRRRLLEREREQAAASALARLSVGDDVRGSVASIQSYGAFVDLGGIEGLLHVSELSAGHVDRVQDVLSVGEEVHVRVVAIEESDKGKRIRLSMKALAQSQQAPDENEVLPATVVRMLPHGMLVQTPKGQGLVPQRELGLAAGADHRRAFSLGQEIEVVLLDGKAGSLRFSHRRVDDVRARQDFDAYQSARKAATGSGMGRLGALLGGLDRANLPPGPAATATAPAPDTAEPAAAPAAAKPQQSAPQNAAESGPPPAAPSQPPSQRERPKRRRIVGSSR